MKKHLLVWTLCFLLLVVFVPVAASGGSINILFNDVPLQLDDPPFLIDGRTFVPMRAFFQAQGAEIYWEEETKTAVGVRGDVRFRIPTIPLGSTLPVVSKKVVSEKQEEEQAVTFGVETRMVDGRLYIPLRFVSEGLGDKVHWDGNTRTITITSAFTPPDPGVPVVDPPDDADPRQLRFAYSFEESAHGWTGDFTDLPADYDEGIYELKFDHTHRPAEVGEGKALMLQGHNRSDDLFMYVKKGLTAHDGIVPNTTYRVRFEVEFATNAPAGAVGIGGPPGEAVWVKVGAAPVEPVPVIQEAMGMLYYLLNVDKGHQNEDGEYALRVGDVAKEYSDDFETYELKTLDNRDEPLEVTSDPEGNLWLFVGTDSGFEGKTVLYYTSIQADLVPVE